MTRRIAHQTWIGGTATLLLTAAHGLGQPANDFHVNDVETQFLALNLTGEPLGWHRNGIADDPRLCKHYQGMARLPRSGTPYFFLTRSGNKTKSCPFQGNDPGELVVVRMGSRPTDGERMRSNKLLRGKRFEDTPPHVDDIAVKSIHFDGSSRDSNGNIWPGWQHLGGCQLIDDVLCIPVEVNHSTGVDDDGGVVLVDVSNPADPLLLQNIDFNRKIGVVAVTYDAPSDRYWFLLTGGDDSFDSGESFEIWQSSSGDLRDPDLTLGFLDHWNRGEADPTTFDKWGSGDLEWQTINFVRDSSTDALYLIGLDNSTQPVTSGTDWARLFRLDRDTNDQFIVNYVAEKHLKLGEPKTGDLDAVSCVYVTPTGNLILYTGEHENDGADGTHRMGEFRSRDVNFPPDCDCNGWVALYENQNGWNDSGSQSYILDYVDRFKDNWDDLRDFEDHSLDLNGFSDEAESVRWCIPFGRRAVLYKDEGGTGDDLWLTGDGTIGAMGSLGEFNNEVTSVLFQDFPSEIVISVGPLPGCPIQRGTPSCPYWANGGYVPFLSWVGPPCNSEVIAWFYAGTYFDLTRPTVIKRPLTLRAANGTVLLK